MLAPLLLVVLTPLGTAAQSGELRLDLGAARSLPPTGTDAVEASYSLLGLTGEQWWSGGSGLGFSIIGGHSMGGAGSDWLSGQVVGELWTDRGGLVDFGVGGRGYTFRVGRPFVYETTTGEFWPQVRFSGSQVSATVKGELGGGRSNIALHRDDAPVRRGSLDLWHRGIVADVMTLIPGGVASGGAGYYEGGVGVYRRGFLELFFSGRLSVRASGEVWDTPRGVQYGGGLGIELPLGGGWSLRADGGRGIPDPLVRAPQGVQGGGFISYRVFENEFVPTSNSVVAVGTPTASGTQVRIGLPWTAGEPPSVLGDFNDWQAQKLQRVGDRWVIDLVLEPGIYHFGFEVNGTWYLPPDAPGRVSDDWGQENATLVVPAVAPGVDSEDDVTGGQG
ncbi:MAG: glycogen-binding domain-containing protein [Longimicrobiales bacterium]